MVEKTLKQLGLNDNEIEVYLAVLKNGKISTAKVASITKINRTTVYSIAKKLITMRLIAEDLGGTRSYLMARPPEQLAELTTDEQKRLDEKKEIVSQAINQLKPFASKVAYSIPKIRFVEEGDIEKHLYEITPTWIETLRGTDNTLWGFQDHTFAELYHKWIDWYWRTVPEDMQLKLLSNKSYIENTMRGKYKRRQIKYWDKSGEFTSTIWITGDYVTMLSLRERPHYLVEIHDPVMARNMRALFKGLWEEVT